MEAWEAWALALSAIAAGTGLISVGFWIMDKVIPPSRPRAGGDRPTLDFHADVVRPDATRTERCRGMLTITAVGDDVARHVDLDTEDCWLGHHHEEGKLAEMRGGTHMELPL